MVGHMKTSLTRSIGFWILLVVSLAAIAVGGWLIAGQIGTMTTTLLDGTATGVEVYVGQSLVVVGSVVLGAGLVGILLSLGLIAARALVPVAAPVVVEPIDWSADPEPIDDVEDTTSPAPADEQSGADDVTSADDGNGEAVEEDQNGSSGSTATATKISVK